MDALACHKLELADVHFLHSHLISGERERKTRRGGGGGGGGEATSPFFHVCQELQRGNGAVKVVSWLSFLDLQLQRGKTSVFAAGRRTVMQAARSDVACNAQPFPVQILISEKTVVRSPAAPSLSKS